MTCVDLFCPYARCESWCLRLKIGRPQSPLIRTSTGRGNSWTTFFSSRIVMASGLKHQVLISILEQCSSSKGLAVVLLASLALFQGRCHRNQMFLVPSLNRGWTYTAPVGGGLTRSLMTWEDNASGEGCHLPGSKSMEPSTTRTNSRVSMKQGTYQITVMRFSIVMSLLQRCQSHGDFRCKMRRSEGHFCVRSQMCSDRWTVKRSAGQDEPEMLEKPPMPDRRVPYCEILRETSLETKTSRQHFLYLLLKFMIKTSKEICG